ITSTPVLRARFRNVRTSGTWKRERSPSRVLSMGGVRCRDGSTRPRIDAVWTAEPLALPARLLRGPSRLARLPAPARPCSDAHEAETEHGGRQDQRPGG